MTPNQVANSMDGNTTSPVQLSSNTVTFDSAGNVTSKEISVPQGGTVCFQGGSFSVYVTTLGGTYVTDKIFELTPLPLVWSPPPGSAALVPHVNSSPTGANYTIRTDATENTYVITITAPASHGGATIPIGRTNATTNGTLNVTHQTLGK